MTIFTICTENYKDALDFSLPSWLKFDSVENVYIYSDFEFTYPDERIVVLNELPKTNDWLEIVGFKSWVLSRVLNTFTDKNLAFIDIDCYMTSDVSEVFDDELDIAPTRIGVKGVSANSGVWFCRNNENVRQFAKEWGDLQQEYRENKIGVVKYAPSYSQLSYSHILHRELKNKTYLNVFPISEEVYNNEADLMHDWMEKIRRGNYKILHFKGRRWRDKEIVDKVLKTVGKIAVYTVIIGKFDGVKSLNPKFRNDADYFLFTDQDIQSSDYIVRRVKNESGNARKESRKYKIQPESYLSGYDYFLYMDGSMELLTSPQTLVNKYLRDSDIAVFNHPWYDCIYMEFAQCLKLGYADPEIAGRQEVFYRDEGYPAHNGLTENGVILRRNCVKIHEFDKFWQSIYDKYTDRDQLSFCYCAWKMGLKYNTFEGQTSNPDKPMTKEFKLHKHGQ